MQNVFLQLCVAVLSNTSLICVKFRLLELLKKYFMKKTQEFIKLFVATCCVKLKRQLKFFSILLEIAEKY